MFNLFEIDKKVYHFMVAKYPEIFTRNVVDANVPESVQDCKYVMAYAMMINPKHFNELEGDLIGATLIDPNKPTDSTGIGVLRSGLQVYFSHIVKEGVVLVTVLWENLTTHEIHNNGIEISLNNETEGEANEFFEKLS